MAPLRASNTNVGGGGGGGGGGVTSTGGQWVVNPMIYAWHDPPGGKNHGMDLCPYPPPRIRTQLPPCFCEEKFGKFPYIHEGQS
jgi:hypothetical protein